MIIILFLTSIIIAFLLRRRYVSNSDSWIMKLTYYCACIVWTPILGIPFYKLITAQIFSGPYSRIYTKDGSYA